MKRLLAIVPILLLAVLVLAGCGQSPEALIDDGNEAFANQDYEGALLAYNGAQEDAPEMAEPYYNAANTYYRLSDYEQAQQQIEQALVSEETQENLDQSSFYNLGNTFFQTQQYEAAIEVYKEALRLNPDDLEAKQNLELALRQLQQQQEQQQDQQQEQQDQEQDQEQQDQRQDQQQNQGQEDQEQQDQQQEQQDQEQDQEQQDQRQDQQQDQGQEDQEQQDQQQDQEKQEQEQQDHQQDQQQDQQQAGGQPDQIVGLSEDQARQLLEAAAEGTESLEQFLQQILVFPEAPPTEDW